MYSFVCILMLVIYKVEIAVANKTEEWVVIGISGVTCGGKTTLANKLQEILSPVYIIHQDDYYYPDDSIKHVKCNKYDHINYDVSSAFDVYKMLSDILKIIEGVKDIKDFSKEGKFSLEGKKFLVVEGITVLNIPAILNMCDLRYYLTLSYEESFSRRVLRGYRPDAEGYFEKCVWPEHLKYKAKIINDKTIKILHGTQSSTPDLVIRDLKSIYK